MHIEHGKINHQCGQEMGPSGGPGTNVFFYYIIKSNNLIGSSKSNNSSYEIIICF
jgi:hypothetical protein